MPSPRSPEVADGRSIEERGAKSAISAGSGEVTGLEIGNNAETQDSAENNRLR